MPNEAKPDLDDHRPRVSTDTITRVQSILSDAQNFNEPSQVSRIYKEWRRGIGCNPS